MSGFCVRRGRLGQVVAGAGEPRWQGSVGTFQTGASAQNLKRNWWVWAGTQSSCVLWECWAGSVHDVGWAQLGHAKCQLMTGLSVAVLTWNETNSRNLESIRIKRWMDISGFPGPTAGKQGKWSRKVYTKMATTVVVIPTCSSVMWPATCPLSLCLYPFESSETLWFLRPIDYAGRVFIFILGVAVMWLGGFLLMLLDSCFLLLGHSSSNVATMM